MKLVNLPKNNLAVIPLSGDPITFGHLNLIERAKSIFSNLIVAIGANPQKKTLFSAEERVKIAQNSLVKFSSIKVMAFSGLLNDFVKQVDAQAVVKGIRNSNDFEYEKNLLEVGNSQSHHFETIFLSTKSEYQFISSSAVKALVIAKGDCRKFVPLSTHSLLERKLLNQTTIGLTGSIACGKSTWMNLLLRNKTRLHFNLIHIDFDELAHKILESDETPYAQKTRKNLVNYFGSSVGNSQRINRKALSSKVFEDQNSMNFLNNTMKEPLLLSVNQEIIKQVRSNQKNIVVLDFALLIEAEWSYLCHHNLIIVDCPENTQRQRLKKRGLNDLELKKRIKQQLSNKEKRNLLTQVIAKDSNGAIYNINGSRDLSFEKAKSDIENFIEIIETKAHHA